MDQEISGGEARLFPSIVRDALPRNRKVKAIRLEATQSAGQQLTHHGPPLQASRAEFKLVSIKTIDHLPFVE